MAWENLHAEVVVLFAPLGRSRLYDEVWQAAYLGRRRAQGRQYSKDKRWRDRFLLKVIRAHAPRWNPTPVGRSPELEARAQVLTRRYLERQAA